MADMRFHASTKSLRAIKYNYYPPMPIGKVWIYRLLFVCVVFLADVNSRSRSLYAMADPSVCRLSVCRLSVTLVHPTQSVEIFGNFFFTIR